MAMMMSISSTMNAINSGMSSTMPSMADLAKNLRDNFNHSDRSVADTHLDIALSMEKELSLHMGGCLKTVRHHIKSFIF